MKQPVLHKFLVYFSILTSLISVSCKKNHDEGAMPVIPISSPITKDTIGGFIKGTLLSGKTYYMNSDIYVKNTDTLAIQPGVKVMVLGVIDKVSYAIHVSGTLLSKGTKENQITFAPVQHTGLDWHKGYWGGIQCDSSAKYVNMSWTNISYTGGPDISGGAQYAFSVQGVGPSATNNNYASNTKVIVENCFFNFGIDDCLRLTGPIKVSIKGNVIKHQGSDDGDNINIKSGVTGDVAYNYIWSSANNAIKVETSLLLLNPQSDVNIYNNTLIAGGWRKQGETTAGILVDRYAKVSIYNNLIVNCQRGIRITSIADTNKIKGHYGYNFFYTTQDSTRKYFYPSDDWGKAQSTDILSTSKTDKDPILVSFDPTVDGKDAAVNPIDNNNPHLKSGSPAIGKGYATAPYSQDLGTTMTPGKDIGAYQTDGSGNQR